MKHLDDIRIGHQFAQRRQVLDDQRIDDRGYVVRRELDQAQPREVRALAHELGVNRDDWRTAQSADKID